MEDGALKAIFGSDWASSRVKTQAAQQNVRRAKVKAVLRHLPGKALRQAR